MGAEEDTDHQDFNQCQTIRKLPAKTLADMEEDNKKAIDPQDFMQKKEKRLTPRPSLGTDRVPSTLVIQNGILILPLLLDALTIGSDLKVSSSRERQS